MLKIFGEKQKGFTLVELLVAMAVAAIIIPAVIYLFNNSISANNRISDRTMAVNQLKNAVNYITKDTVTSGSVAPTNSNFPLTLTWIDYPEDRITYTYSIDSKGTLVRTEYENKGDGSGSILINTINVARNVNSSQTNCVWTDSIWDTNGILLHNGNLTVNMTISIGSINESRSFTVTPRVIQSNVNIASTVTSLISSPSSSSDNPSPYDGSVTFTANVSGKGGTPTGTVIFSDGSTVMGTSTLTGGSVSYSTLPYYLPPGPNYITASYSGDDTYSPSTSAILIQWVQSTTLPVVTGITPISGSTSGGTSVTITGMNFTGVTVVKFGGSTTAIPQVYSDTSITVISPAGAVGIVDVTVTTDNGTSEITPIDQFTYQGVPTVSAISPNSGGLLGGTSVTVTGTNFAGALAVNFGSKKATTYTVNSATSITAYSPPGTVGTPVDITVITPSGTSQTSSADQFTYTPAPTITGISPVSGPSNGGTTVTITGTYLSNAITVEFGSNSVIIRSNTPTQITVSSPAGVVGSVDITVTTPSGTSTKTPADKFTYLYAPPPAVTGVTPTSGPMIGGTIITITGTNFTGATAVKFGVTAVTNFTINTDTSITATTPVGTLGAVDVTVTTPSGTSVINQPDDQYTYTAMTATFNPTSGPVGTQVTVTGSGWRRNENLSVTVGDITTSSSHLSISSGGNLSGYIIVPSSLTSGPQTIVITGSSSGTQTFSNAFMVTAAATFNPISGSVGTIISVSGSGWTASDTISRVTIGGITATSTLTVNSSGILSGTITVPLSLTAGSYDIIITGSSTGVETYSNAFTVIITTVTFNPTSGPVGTQVTVTGSGWRRNENLSVTVGDITTSSSHLSISSGGNLSGYIIVPSSLAGGPQTIVITGSSSGTQTFNNAFTVTAAATFNLTSGPVGTNITVTGTGWAASDLITSVTIGGITATNTLIVNGSGTMSGTIIVPSSLIAGSHNIIITGSNTGAQTFANAFTVTIATATFNPTSGPVRTIITVNGTGWAASDSISSVTIGGTTSTNTLTVNSNGTLSGTITVPSITAGLYPVIITGTKSGVQTFANAFTVTIATATFNPTSGPVRTIITVNGTGWAASDSISSVTIGGTTSTDTLTVNSNGTLSGTITVPSITAGLYPVVITGTKSGVQTFANAFTVTQGPSATSVSSNHNPSTPGQSVTFDATVSGSGNTPSGTVTFYDGATALGTRNLNYNGQATYSAPGLSLGSHSITAVYGGDANYIGSTSPVLIQTVSKSSSSTSVTSSVNPSGTGQLVTFTATVSGSGNTPTGTVTFYDGANALGTRNLNYNGQATVPTSGLSLGSHSITAAYGGDTTYNGSTSSVLTQMVSTPNPVPTLISMSPNNANRNTTLNVILTGTNFISGVSSVNTGTNWIQVNSTTVNGSGTQITVNITIANNNMARGTYQFSVTNNAPGGGTSGTQTFRVN